MSNRSNRRFVVGPANFAGQAFHWAVAVEQHLKVPSWSFAASDSLIRWPAGKHRFSTHKRLPHHRASTAWGKRLRMRGVLKGATHVAADGFLPFYHRYGRASIADDIHRLHDRGIKIALIAHGSDVRDPDAHMARYPLSYYASSPSSWVRYLREYSRRNRELVRSSGLPIFVSTPDLLLDLPEATWLPLRVELSDWQGRRKPWLDNPPTVLHLPSRRDPPIKGTEIIDVELRNLEASGHIQYLRPESVPHRLMPSVIDKADIVVDQILGGYYGVAALEGMAAGRLVVGFIGSEVAPLIPECPPMVNAPPDHFGRVMRDVLSEREKYHALAVRGPSYVHKWHDGRASADALSGFIDS